MKEARLAEDIYPETTEVVLEDTDAVTAFPTDGGIAFLGDQDCFWYSARSDNTLSGVSGLRMFHESGEVVDTTFGYKVSDIVSAFERSPKIDEDGYSDVLCTILDVGFEEAKRIEAFLIGSKNPTFAHESCLRDLVETFDVSFPKDEDVNIQRVLAMTIAQALRDRFSERAFKAVVFWVLGYVLNIRLVNYYVPFELGSSYGILYGPPPEISERDHMRGLWRIDNSPEDFVPNEISGGPKLSISDVGMWNTDALCSMFEKDQVLEFDDAATHCSINGSLETGLHFDGKKSLFIELWVKFPLVPSPTPARILSKTGVIDVFWTPQNTILVWLYDSDGTKYALESSSLLEEGGGTDASGSDAEPLFKYIVIGLRPDSRFLLINERIEDLDRESGFLLKDVGGDWVFGGELIDTSLSATLDMVAISGGNMHVTDFLSYYEPIRRQRTGGTEEDELTYLYTPYNKDGVLLIEVANDDGNHKKHEVLQYLAEDWFELGDNEFRWVAHSMIDNAIGQFSVL